MTRNNPWAFPFSGDVAQAINPWSFLLRGPQQAGLVNITTGRTDNPELERRIVEDVASYGRQLGRIIDALTVVLAHLPSGERTARENDAVEAFTRMAERIAAVKGEDLPSRVTVARLDRLIEDVRALESVDAERYRELVTRIREAFPAD